mmetsp:Transcript_13889/g.15669  ORF Transcript_13889/g.15669 Transcript_13889/m.15669 type:complete len:335 (+) Transcript_13889:303-1307(+)
MANSAFDPLRNDPFASYNEGNQQLVTYQQGGEQPTSAEQDALLLFANNTNKVQPINNNQNVRASRKQKTMQNSPRSVASGSSLGSRSAQSRSVVDDANFAPPPEMPVPRDYSASLFHVKFPPDPQSRPLYEEIKHSGMCVSRISNRTKLLKIWKHVFWIIYGDNQLYVFKSKNIFDEWMMNPHLSKMERKALVKLHIDFQSDSRDHGYQASPLKTKYYRKGGMISQFKLDKWDFNAGPTILAAFGSENQQDAYELNVIIRTILSTAPTNMRRLGYVNVNDTDDNSMSSRNGSNYYSGGESIRSAPTFARLPTLTSGIRAISSDQNSIRSRRSMR